MMYLDFRAVQKFCQLMDAENEITVVREKQNLCYRKFACFTPEVIRYLPRCKSRVLGMFLSMTYMSAIQNETVATN